MDEWRAFYGGKINKKALTDVVQVPTVHAGPRVQKQGIVDIFAMKQVSLVKQPATFHHRIVALS